MAYRVQPFTGFDKVHAKGLVARYPAVPEGWLDIARKLPLTRCVWKGARILMIGGAIPVPSNPDAVQLWAMVRDDLGNADAMSVTRATLEYLKWLDLQGYSRIEAVVKPGNTSGVRWTRLLGFEDQGPVGEFTMFARETNVCV